MQAGNFARLVLLDWDTERVYETYKSKGINTPYTGKKLTGSPKAIVTGTKVTEKSLKRDPRGSLFDILRGSKKLAKKICKTY